MAGARFNSSKVINKRAPSMALGNRPVRCGAPSQSKADEVQDWEPADLDEVCVVPSMMLRLRATGVHNSLYCRMVGRSLPEHREKAGCGPASAGTIDAN